MSGSVIRIVRGVSAVAAIHVCLGSIAVGQTPDRPAATAAASRPAASSTRLAWVPLPDSLRPALERFRERGDLGPVVAIDSIVLGPALIAQGDTVPRSIIVYGGSLELNGVVDGSVAVVGGDLIVGSGARIAGSASAVGGTVRVNGGQVAGDIRSASAEGAVIGGGVDALDPRSVEVVGGLSPAAAAWRAARLVAAFFALFLLLGIGILLFSQPTFESVLRVLEARFARAFWTGLLAQFAILPVMLLLVVGLAISIVGILLIPFAVVSYAVAVAGLLALGFLAAARLTGGFFISGADATQRNANLRGLLAGLSVYFGLWMLAAALSWHPLVGIALRAIAVAATWVAVTVGLGAIIAAGLAARRARAEAHLPRVQDDPMAWQTPTPITGVVAARRTLSPTRSA